MSEPETKEPSTNTTATAPAGAGETASTSQAQSNGAQELALAAEVETARAEAASNHDKYMRAAADLENFRRRTIREKDELRITATSRVLEDIFPVIDTLALALEAARQTNADTKSLIGGIDMVLAQLKSALGKHGLKEINPLGQPFDPHQHESISHQPSKDVKEEHVLTVVRTGYSLNGRLLRAASVVVSSGPQPEEKR